jgi:excisionase family DNA binding protein
LSAGDLEVVPSRRLARIGARRGASKSGTGEPRVILPSWSSTSWPPRRSPTLPPPPDELLTASQAGDYLRTGERFVRRLVAERRISYVKLGKYVRLQRSVLDAFIESGRVPQEPEVHRL